MLTISAFIEVYSNFTKHRIFINIPQPSYKYVKNNRFWIKESKQKRRLGHPKPPLKHIFKLLIYSFLQLNFQVFRVFRSNFHFDSQVFLWSLVALGLL